MELAQHVHLTANALAHIVQLMVHVKPAPHMDNAKLVQDIQSNFLVQDILLVQFVLQIIHVNIVQDILHAQFVEHIISANTATDTPMDQMHLADVLHPTLIIAAVKTITK
jgi:hypothetical protein